VPVSFSPSGSISRSEKLTLSGFPVISSTIAPMISLPNPYSQCVPGSKYTGTSAICRTSSRNVGVPFFRSCSIFSLMPFTVGSAAFGSGNMQYGRPHIIAAASRTVIGCSNGTSSIVPFSLRCHLTVCLHSGRYSLTGSEKRNFPSSYNIPIIA